MRAGLSITRKLVWTLSSFANSVARSYSKPEGRPWASSKYVAGPFTVRTTSSPASATGAIGFGTSSQPAARQASNATIRFAVMRDSIMDAAHRTAHAKSLRIGSRRRPADDVPLGRGAGGGVAHRARVRMPVAARPQLGRARLERAPRQDRGALQRRRAPRRDSAQLAQ